MLSLIRDLASIAAEVVGEFCVEAPKNPQYIMFVELEINIHRSVKGIVAYQQPVSNAGWLNTVYLT